MLFSQKRDRHRHLRCSEQSLMLPLQWMLIDTTQALGLDDLEQPLKMLKLRWHQILELLRAVTISKARS